MLYLPDKLMDMLGFLRLKKPDRPEITMMDGSPVTDDHQEVDPSTGMQKGYVVLSEAERAKGFIRLVQNQYEHDRCGAVTRIGIPLAETYACAPGFYAKTFCVACREHFPVGEFVWFDREIPRHKRPRLGT